MKRFCHSAMLVFQPNWDQEPFMVVKWTHLVIAILAGLLIGTGRNAVSAPPAWGKLAPGPFAVGFKLLWQLDYSRLLIAHARRQPDVDWQHISLIGHSLGAQAILMFRAQAASAVDAVVSLDTTRDYQTLVSAGWQDMTKLVLENSQYFNGSLLMVANAHALFHLADSLDRAERYYFTLLNQGHNDFSTRGFNDGLSRTRICPGQRMSRAWPDRRRDRAQLLL